MTGIVGSMPTNKITVVAGLLLDLGNSKTRVSVIYGTRIFRFDMSNEFMEMPRDYKIPATYRKGGAEMFAWGGSYFFNGSIVQREFANKKMRPSSTAGDKPKQITTELTLNLAFLRAVELLQWASGRTTNELDITFKLGILLPPLQLDTAVVPLANLLARYKEVHRLLPFEAKYSFKVDPNPIVEGEGIAAFFGALYQAQDKVLLPDSQNKSLDKGDVLTYQISEPFDAKVAPENSKFETGYVLVLDIGAGTTDVALILDSTIVDNSRNTFNYGGNTVKSSLTTSIRKKFGFTPSDMDRVVKYGILDEGDYHHDVSDLVTQAKRDYADEMIVELLRYLEGLSGVSTRNLKGILVVGGGSMPSIAHVERTFKTDTIDGVPQQIEVRTLYGDEDSPPVTAVLETVSPAMSSVLVEYLKDSAPFLLELSIPEGSQRSLNIDGLEIIYRIEAA